MHKLTAPPPQWTLTVWCVWRDDDTDSVITTSCMQRERMHVMQAQIAITHFRRAATPACSEEDDWTYCRIQECSLSLMSLFFSAHVFSDAASLDEKRRLSFHRSLTKAHTPSVVSLTVFSLGHIWKNATSSICRNSQLDTHIITVWLSVV